MKKISLVIFCIWVVNVANAQQNQRRLSYSELFNEIQKQTNSTYYLENAEIYYSTADLSRMYYYEDTSTIKIDREIVFKNVLWQIGQLEEETYTFFKTHHIEFKKEVRFEIDSQVNIQRDEKIYSTFPIFHYCLFQALFINSQIIDDENHIKFDKCDINKIILRISNNSASNKQEEGLIKKSVEFHQSNINVVEIYGKAIDLILFDKCNIQRLNITEVKKAQINIHKCIFEAKEKQNSGITITKSTIEKIQIDSCTFEKIPEEWKKENPNLWSRAGIKDVNCEKLIITNSLFNSHFYIIGTKITEEIFLENNQFNNDFSLGSGSAKSGFERNIINFENAFMPFKQFKKGLSTEIGGKQTTVYYGNTPEQLADSVEYEHLLTYYNKFYKMYQDQKDRASANACFVLLKRLETRRLGYLASKDRTNFALLIEWQFNRFLDYTCEYGTNPFLALTISLKIMIIFALLLSVFPSEKDYLQPSEFRGALQRWGLALQKEGGFTEIQNEKIQEKFNHLENFRKSLELTEGNVPSVLAFFLKPLLFSAKLYYRLQMWFLRKIDFTKGNWHEMSKRKRFWISTRIFFAILFLLFWGLVMRIVNSMALSMNCFVTLGYGEIKAKGIAKYLVVIEGVLGWVMLTVFSASLITQLMG